MSNHSSQRSAGSVEQRSGDVNIRLMPPVAGGGTSCSGACGATIPAHGAYMYNWHVATIMTFQGAYCSDLVCCWSSVCRISRVLYIATLKYKHRMELLLLLYIAILWQLLMNKISDKIHCLPPTSYFYFLCSFSLA